MRVVLRNPNAADGRDYRHSLTLGREYEVLGIECDDLRLLTNDGEPVLFDPACFEVTEPSEPDFWIEYFPHVPERYAYPPGWGVPGFFEDWHDGVVAVRMQFISQLADLYPWTEARSARARTSDRDGE